MALTAAVRGLSTPPTPGFNLRWLEVAGPALWSALLSALIAGPWLAPGYLFGADWPGPTRFDLPAYPYSWAPIEAGLAAVSYLTSAEIAGKFFVIGVLFVGGLLAFRAALAEGFVPRAVASTIFVVNPFVYGRLQYGQLFVLAGYALLPWVALRFRRLLLKPDIKASVVLGACLVALGAASAHMFLIACALGVILAASHAIAAGDKIEYLKQVAPSLLLTAAVTLIASAYWVVPLLLGRGPVATTIAGIGPAELGIYAAVPDPQLGLLPNLLGLYGFWAENVGRFSSMKEFVPLWPVVLLGIVAVAGVGAVSAFAQRRDQLAPWVAGLLVAAAIALVLEMGTSHAATRGLVSWLDGSLPLYRGMRDSAKWAALIALVYSQLTALGAAAIVAWLRGHPLRGKTVHWTGGLAAGLLVAVPLYYGNGLLFGMHGEIKPSSYPAGWYAADRVLAADSHARRALFLPWHEYMTYSFIRNQNKLVAPPAPTFFSVPVLVSADPEVAGAAAPTDPDQVAISGLVRDGATGQWANVLAALDINYVLVAREVDWASFRYLDDQVGLVKLRDFDSIVVYSVAGRLASASQTSSKPGA